VLPSNSTFTGHSVNSAFSAPHHSVLLLCPLCPASLISRCPVSSCQAPIYESSQLCISLWKPFKGSLGSLPGRRHVLPAVTRHTFQASLYCHSEGHSFGGEDRSKTGVKKLYFLFVLLIFHPNFLEMWLLVLSLYTLGKIIFNIFFLALPSKQRFFSFTLVLMVPFF
jgi:hypothetical protein